MTGIQLQIDCSSCGSTNELTASTGVGDAEIACSQCGHMLGNWTQLAEAGAQRSTQAALDMPPPAE